MSETWMTKILGKSSEKRQDLAEYALLIGLIAFTVILAVMLIGEELRDFFNNIATGFLF